MIFSKHHISHKQILLHVNKICLTSIFFFLFFTTQTYAVLTVTVEYGTTPLKNTFSWNAQVTGKSVSIYRRILGQEDSKTWLLLATVENPYTKYIDSTIVNEVTYEYKFINTSDAATAAYIATGVNIPVVENRGTILLVVDNTISAALSAELIRLEQDFRGDGWAVIRYNSPRHGYGTPKNLRDWIKAQYNANPSQIKSVLLFGHLPICMSGYIAPDGHEAVPLPTDLFYADMDGVWTDIANNTSTAGFPNIPGDGIYDQNYIPGNNRVEIQVGRVDLFGMTAFNENEVELLRNYLNKDHNWRHAITKSALKGIAGNSYLSMERSGVNSLFGSENVLNGRFADSNNKAYSWAVDFGDANGVNYPTFNYKSTFYINFGSHKQKFEKNNNQMRALLCLPDYGLTCAWGSRPFWFFHHMGMGETIGYSAYRTQNNGLSDYKPACSYWFQGGIWNNLMGDPTLRLHIVAPPANLKAIANATNVNLFWSESPDANSGYLVYRENPEKGTFTKVTLNPVMGTTYSDTCSGLTNSYMIRAVKLEQGASGSYFNLSQGVFVQNPFLLQIDSLPPTVPSRLKASKINATGFTLTWNVCTDNIKVTSYEIFKDGSSIGVTDTTSFDIMGLTPNTSYLLSVKAKDGSNNVSNESSGLTVTTTKVSGIQNPVFENCVIYPNPIIDKINTNLNVSGLYDIHIFNLLGEMIFQSEKIHCENGKISLACINVKTGLYFINIKTENKIFTGKFYKE